MPSSASLAFALSASVGMVDGIHRHAANGRKPDAARAVLAAGGLIVAAIALAVEQAVGFAEGDHLRLRRASRRHVVQFPARDAVDSLQPAQPQIPEVVLLDVIDGVLVQPVPGGEGEEATRGFLCSSRREEALI